MSLVRRIIAVLMAASFLWAGSAAALQAHAHEAVDDHGSILHELASDPDMDHHEAAAWGCQHHFDAGVPDHADEPGAPRGHEHGILHVHTMCFVALQVESLLLDHLMHEMDIDQPMLVVSLHTRSITPADRPPRSVL